MLELEIHNSRYFHADSTHVFVILTINSFFRCVSSALNKIPRMVNITIRVKVNDSTWIIKCNVDTKEKKTGFSLFNDQKQSFTDSFTFCENKSKYPLLPTYKQYIQFC